MFTTSTGYLRAVSRGAAVARLHRGDRLHLHGAGQRRPGRRHRPVRADLRLHELRDRRPGAGGEVRPRRARLRRRRLQPRGRHGRRRDVGAGQADDLPRPPDQAQHRRHRPPPRRLLVRDAAPRQRHPGLRDREHRRGRDAHLAGALRRLPGAERLRPQRLRLRHLRAGGGGQGLSGRRRQRRGVGAVGLRRASPDRTGPLHDDDRGQDRATSTSSSGRGGGGLGDPLLRSEERIEEDIAGGHIQRALGRARLRPREPRRPDARPPRPGPPGSRVVGRAAPAHPRPGPDRDREGDVRRVDAPRAGLGGRVPRLLGPARGLRLRRRHPDRDGAAGRARQDHPRGVDRRLPRRLGGLPPRGRPGRGAGHHRGDRRRPSPTCSTRSSPAAPSRTSSPRSRTPTASTSGSPSSRPGSTTTTRSSSPTARG